MSNEEKIKTISRLLVENVPHSTLKNISTESEKTLFCLFIDEKGISVIVEDRFIENNSIEEITAFLGKRLYHEIHSGQGNITPVGDDIVIWPNDEPCQRLHKY